jgi:hypothetical protein
MKPMAAALTGAVISGVAMYAVGVRAPQADAFVRTPGYVQTVDGQYAPVSHVVPAVQPRTLVRTAPAPARVVRAAQPRTVYRETPVYREAPAATTAQPTVYRDDRVDEARPDRTKTKTALIIGGSAASGAGVGAIVGGKKGALIGAAIGGGAASIYEATRRR